MLMPYPKAGFLTDGVVYGYLSNAEAARVRAATEKAGRKLTRDEFTEAVEGLAT